MALNARFLQKSGVSPGAGVAAVGVNALMGAVAHLILLVIFFTLAGHQLAHAFKLPPASKLLLILAILAALVGIVLATRRGRRLAATRLLPGLRSAAVSLRSRQSSPTGWPPTGSPSSPAGPPGGSCRDETMSRSREVPAAPHVEHHGNHWPRIISLAK